jgi:MscS family membrane protein
MKKRKNIFISSVFIIILLLTNFTPLAGETISVTPTSSSTVSQSTDTLSDETSEENTGAEESKQSFITRAREAHELALKYLEDVSTESSAITTSTTLSEEEKNKQASIITEKTKWAKVSIENSKLIVSSVENLPSPTTPVRFFETLEDLKILERKKANELELSKENQAALLLKGENDRITLASEQIDFFTKQFEILRDARKSMKDAFSDLYKTQEEQATVRTKAYEALAKEKAEEISRIEEKAKDLALQALEDEKKNLDLAEQARKEILSANSEETRDLARLRLAFAELQTIVKDYEARTLETELEVKKAEVNYQTDRSMLSEKVSELKKLSPSDNRVKEKLLEWTQKRDELKNEIDLLDKESNVLRNQVSSLRQKRDAARLYYDDLDSRLNENKNNKIFRQRVFYARSIFRLTSDRLDQFRMRIELIEDHKKQLQLHDDPYKWATRALEKHTTNLYFGQTSSQIGYFFLGLLFTYIIAIIVNGGINVTLRKLAVKSPWNWDNVAIEELKTPIRIALILLGLWMTLSVLSLSESTLKIVHKVRMTMEILWMGFLIWRFLNVIHRVLQPKFAKTETTLDDQLLSFIGKALRAILILITGIYLLENFGWHVSSLLAGLGIGGLAFALAAKDTLANLFGSIVLFIDRPFYIGNWVIIGGAEGIVEDIGIRSTRIRTFKDTIVTIPNATVANSPAENIHSFRKRRLFFTLTLRLDTPVAKVEQTVEEMRNILTDHPMILDGYYVYVSGIPADGIEIMVYCFVSTRDWGEWLHHSQTVYLSVLKMLEEIGVGLAFGTRTIELENKSPIHIAGLDEFLKNKNDI